MQVSPTLSRCIVSCRHLVSALHPNLMQNLWNHLLLLPDHAWCHGTPNGWLLKACTRSMNFWPAFWRLEIFCLFLLPYNRAKCRVATDAKHNARHCHVRLAVKRVDVARRLQSLSVALQLLQHSTPALHVHRSLRSLDKIVIGLHFFNREIKSLKLI